MKKKLIKYINIFYKNIFFVICINSIIERIPKIIKTYKDIKLNLIISKTKVKRDSEVLILNFVFLVIIYLRNFVLIFYIS